MSLLSLFIQDSRKWRSGKIFGSLFNEEITPMGILISFIESV